jgi:hypothetical protein
MVRTLTPDANVRIAVIAARVHLELTLAVTERLTDDVPVGRDGMDTQ